MGTKLRVLSLVPGGRPWHPRWLYGMRALQGFRCSTGQEQTPAIGRCRLCDAHWNLGRKSAAILRECQNLKAVEVGTAGVLGGRQGKRAPVPLLKLAVFNQRHFFKIPSDKTRCVLPVTIRISSLLHSGRSGGCIDAWCNAYLALHVCMSA